MSRTRRLARRLLAGPTRLATGLVVEGRERLPAREEPLILCCNHAAYADTLLIAAAIRPPFVLCGAKPRLFRTPARRALLSALDVLRVDDRDSYLRDVGALLAQGRLILSYPEMGRNPERLGRFETWPAEAAVAAKVEVLPLFLRGTRVGDTAFVLSVGHRLRSEDPVALTAAIEEQIRQLGAT